MWPGTLCVQDWDVFNLRPQKISQHTEWPIYAQVARGVIGLVVTGHYPLNHHPARLAVEHLEQYSFGWKEISQWFSYLQSIIFVLSTTAVAVVVSSISCDERRGLK